MQSQQIMARMDAMAAAQSNAGATNMTSVVVPPGSKPGGQLKVPHPEGGTFVATIPPNVHPGVKIAIPVPPKPRVSPEQLNAAVEALRAEFRQEIGAVRAELAHVKAKNVKLTEQLASARPGKSHA